jgi:hypothetical protein
MGSGEGHQPIGAALQRPAQLVHGMVMTPAQREQIRLIGLPALLPRKDMVDFREVRE